MSVSVIRSHAQFALGSSNAEMTDTERVTALPTNLLLWLLVLCICRIDFIYPKKAKPTGTWWAWLYNMSVCGGSHRTCIMTCVYWVKKWRFTYICGKKTKKQNTAMCSLIAAQNWFPLQSSATISNQSLPHSLTLSLSPSPSPHKFSQRALQPTAPTAVRPYPLSFINQRPKHSGDPASRASGTLKASSRPVQSRGGGGGSRCRSVARMLCKCFN